MDGKVDGDKVSFAVKVDMNGTDAKFVSSGTMWNRSVGIKHNDPWSTALSVLVLVMVAFLAGFAPARIVRAHAATGAGLFAYRPTAYPDRHGVCQL